MTRAQVLDATWWRPGIDEDRSEELTQDEDWLVDAMHMSQEWRKATAYAKQEYGVILDVLAAT